jgi:hypothetical protein
MTNPDASECPDHRFLVGLVTGSVLGVGAMVFGSRLLSGLRNQVVDSARGVGRRVQGVRDDVCDAVAHGAQELERCAIEAKTDPDAEMGSHAAAHHSRSSARQVL